MKQKCPNCGRWCDGEHISMLSRAGREADATTDKFSNIGGNIGGLFGKKGEKFGRLAGAYLSGATFAAFGKGVVGALTGNEYSFRCPSCGCEWEASDDSEDQTEEAKKEFSELVDRISKSLDDGKYEKALSLCDKLSEIHSGEGAYWSAHAKRLKAESLITDDLNEKEREEKKREHDVLINSAIKDINACIDYYSEKEDDPVSLGYAVAEKGWVFTEKSNKQARKWFMMAMKSNIDGIKESAKNGYEYATSYVMSKLNSFLTVDDRCNSILANNEDMTPQDQVELREILVNDAEQNKFCNLESFSDRQFVFIVKNEEKIAGCYDQDDNINWVFTQDELPADIYFPTGHPIPNTLYIAHPAKKGLYLPFEGAEDVMFHDKVEDFCRLAQCLGAVEITFSSIKGKSVNQSAASSLSTAGDGGRKKLNASGEYNETNNDRSEYTSSNEVGLSFTYKPTKKPYCPNDIPWLEADPSWKSFVKQRLEGNILSYTKRISSSETTNMSSNKTRGVKASFENLMASVDSRFDATLDTTFSSIDSTIWEISIRFKSIDEFEDVDAQTKAIQSSNQMILSQAEEEYKEEVLFILEDGEISVSERRLLERKRQKLCISEERAKQIEESCAPSLTEDEKEYLEIFKEFSEDGEITERKRKMLNREAASLGISAERQQEIELLS